MPKTMYMHTLDGKPASWDDIGEYIHFVYGRDKARLFPNLRTIRKQQEADIRNLGGEVLYKYGHILVEVQDA